MLHCRNFVMRGKREMIFGRGNLMCEVAADDF
jgi:hypothetical protein